MAFSFTAKPEVLEATLVLRDCYHPEVQVTFKLFQPSIRIVRITLSIYRNENSKPAHQQDMEYEHGKLDYQCGFLVPELTDHEHKDRYKLAVEVEYDVNETKITSDHKTMKREQCKLLYM